MSLVDRLRALPPRALVAVAGPPGAGKSTIAERLAGEIEDARVLPMDGFHLDDRILNARGHRPRKGAPHTFDVAGLARTLQAVREGGEIFHPVFDRSREIAIAGAGVIEAEVSGPVIVEGNYLLLDRPEWQALGPWALTVFLSVPMDELERRLSARWASLEGEALLAKMEGNDLPNARLVVEESVEADVVLDWPGDGV